MKSSSARWLAAAAAVGIASSALATATVNGVSTHKSGDGVEVVITGTGLTRPRIIRVNHNHSYLLEFDGKLVGRGSRLNVADGGVDHVNWGWYSAKPARVRVHVKLDGTEEPTLVQTGDGWTVGVHTNTKASVKPANSPTKSGKALVYNIPDVAPLDPIVMAPSKKTTELLKLNAWTQLASVSSPVTPALAPATKPAAKTESSATMPIAGFTKLDGTPVPEQPKSKKSHKRPAKTASKMEVKGEAAAPAAETSQNNSGFVSLDFVSTDVTQVLKALALQSGVNIITSPEVNGKITISLDHTTVREAMDLVTAMAGVRYARVGNTYVVATPARFNSLMKQMTGKEDETTVTRVVPLFSGMGNQIKTAIFKSYPVDNGEGRYDLILPSEETTVTQTQNVGAPDPNADPTKPSGDKTTVESKTAKSAPKDSYLLLLGNQSRIDAVEKEIRRLDVAIAHSLNIPVSEDMQSVQDAYRTTNNSAMSLLKAISDPYRSAELSVQPNQTMIGKVQLFASSGAGTSDQILVMSGPKSEVEVLKGVLKLLDVPQLGQEAATIYDVKYGDPRALRDDLAVQFPGLVIAIPAASAGNPSLFKDNAAKSTAQAQLGGNSAAAPTAAPAAATGAPAPGGAAAPAPGGSSGGSSSGSMDGGLTLPFTAQEAMAFPMKLVLRGGKAQIAQALDYLKMVDVAPKQIAIEMRVVELTKEDAINAGVDWNLFTGGAVKFVRLNGQQGTPTNNSAGFNVNTNGVRGDVLAQLDKIVTTNHLIARPNTLALDGRQAELFVGDAIRYVESIISSQNGPSITTGTVRVGVRLVVLPRVGGDHSITLDMRPTVSFLRGFTQVAQIQGQLPQTSERTSQSTINMQSGETIAIGGLIQEQDRRDWKGLPILSEIPIVGNLFRRTTNDKVKTELVIFLTAKEVEGPVGANKLAMQEPEPKKGKGGSK